MQSIGQWLERLGLGEYAEAFVRNCVDLDIAKDLTDGDLRELGVEALGHRKKLLKAIAGLNRAAELVTQVEPAASIANTPAAERRQLTVLFCDLVGSTALSEALDAEDLRELMRAYMRAAGSVIDRYKGHVAQYLGDGLMCYFGWPTAHEDDAERAVRSALEIVEAVKLVTAPQPLHVRVGIASGQVVIGEAGDDEASLPRLAVGETPNLAARMQGLAGAGEIVIAATTRQLVGGAFELDDIGEHALKGFAAPVHSWKVTGIVAAQGRFEAAHGSRLTPFVGRESDLALMKQRWNQAKEGNGQVVLLCGEPGIGKSHLAQVFRERISRNEYMLLHYQCSPYHTNTALYPLIEQLKSSMKLDRADDVYTRIDKLEALLSMAFADISSAAPLFGTGSIQRPRRRST